LAGGNGKLGKCGNSEISGVRSGSNEIMGNCEKARCPVPRRTGQSWSAR